MNLRIGELKGRSRECLIGNYTVLIAAQILIFLIMGICSIPFSQMIQTGIRQGVSWQILPALIGMFVVALVASLFSAGLSQMHLKLARGQKVKFSDLLYPFQNHPDKFIGAGVIILLITLACQLPGSLITGMSGVQLTSASAGTAFPAGIMAGMIVMLAGLVVEIVLMLGLSLTMYILLDDPYGVRVFEAMRLSWRLMKGRKLHLFGLMLSFLGWIVIGILSFGLGLLWVGQYYEQTICHFYLELRTNVDRQEQNYD